MSARASCARSSASSPRPAGYVLPVQRWTAQAPPGWISEIWRLRRGRLFLVPGDSPIGFRLPLNSLPYSCRPSTRIWCRPIRSTSAARWPIPRRWPRSSPIAATDAAAPRDRAGCSRGAGRVRRDGRAGAHRRHSGAHRLDGRAARRAAVRVHAAGRTAGGLSRAARGRSKRPRPSSSMPVHVEGYEPPPDPRLNVIKVTPDPGVIEVNVHPAASWREAVDITRTLYEDARLSRLGTDKFMIDGRHTGTGGGNHVVLGGLNAADSPFLRRPDLLKSLILYWQRHPSLSYLFSGLFIGPDQPGAACRRSAARPALRTGDRARHGAGARRGRAAAAVAGRPPVPQSPGRRHRQHPSRRDLHRQAVLA